MPDETYRRRMSLPDDAEEWWTSVSHTPYNVVLKWGVGVHLQLGELRPNPSMFRYDPRPDTVSEEFKEEDIASGAERFDRLFGKVLTRAGWQLPEVDPAVFFSIVRLRRQTDARLEFILDTNAMIEGIGHWLAALFAERCDLVVTAVSLRELQDQHGGAKFGAQLRRIVNNKPVFEKEVLGRRQNYLAAMRFREFTGFERVIWRELELDDTSLMLSRSGLDRTDKKSSEADTALLRETRRCIRDRVRGLERFFVTGDVALARRAATELPEESLIAARVRDLVRGRIYTPILWWPTGADQGAALAGHTPMRLIWELLAVADEVELRSVEQPGPSWVFKAFDTQMWPSDYLSPWVDCTGTGVEKHVTLQTKVDAGAPPNELASPGGAPMKTGNDARLFAEISVPDIPPIDANLRVGTGLLLNTLWSLVQGKTELSFGRPAPSPEAERHLEVLLEALGFAKLSKRRAETLARLVPLSIAWRAGDRETVSRLLMPYQAYAEQIVPNATAHAKRPDRTVLLARGLAAHLGQGMDLGGNWLPGGANPTLAEVRDAILSELQIRKVLTTYDLFTRIFLGRLAVSPVRAMGMWDHMEGAHVFDGIEFRQGGDAPSVERRQRIVAFSDDGWFNEDIALDKFRGYRDLVPMRSSHDG